LSAPYWIHSQYLAIYENEKKWIELDNKTIELGRKDRALLNELEDIKSTLQKLELLHHPLHLCKTCKHQDIALEVKMRLLIARAQYLIFIEWQKNLIRRPLSVKISTCPICTLNSKIIFLEEMFQSLLKANTLLLRKVSGKWNYEIKTETNGHYSF
jgi:superfamily II helicase